MGRLGVAFRVTCGLAGGLTLGLALAACGQHPRGSPSGQSTSPGSANVATAPAPDRLAPLHTFEEERRHAANFAHAPPSDRALGADPIAVRALPGAGPARFVGLLRGRDALVLLDASLHGIARAPAPALPTGLAVTDDGEVAVSGEQAPGISRYTLHDGQIHAMPALVLDPRVLGFRDVALGGTREDRAIYAVEEREGRLFATSSGGKRTFHACTGAFRVARAGSQLVVDCLLDHALAVFDLDAHGLPIEARRRTIHHDGPIWGFDAVPTPGGLLIAAGGVEDHVLDRTEGSFGFVDSFVFLYLVPPAGEPRRLAAVNVSEQGVITPKAVSLQVRAGGATVLAAGYGSDRLVELTWPGDLTAAPTVATRPILPGAASMATSGDVTAFADPLLDAWFALAPAPVPVPVPDAAAPPRSAASRVGEALFFTNLMAPWNKSEGRLSRFTCETCHFEGYVDGRTHHTGRGDVHATTKPLLGLFNNRPHFSRALDTTLATMVDNEFRAAGSKSDHDPWFTATEANLSFTPLLGVPLPELDALGLRRALMSFFMDFTHRPNPAALGHTTFTDLERRGAEAFRARGCEGCHEARLSTDDPSTRVAPETWEALVLSREGPIVWASSAYRRTGVEPYVHDDGARPPSLRRLYKKRPYFTNGSAKSVREVLERARFRGADFWHDKAPEGATGMSAEEVEGVGAFLDLL